MTRRLHLNVECIFFYQIIIEKGWSTTNDEYFLLLNVVPPFRKAHAIQYT